MSSMVSAWCLDDWRLTGAAGWRITLPGGRGDGGEAGGSPAVRPPHGGLLTNVEPVHRFPQMGRGETELVDAIPGSCTKSAKRLQCNRLALSANDPKLSSAPTSPVPLRPDLSAGTQLHEGPARHQMKAADPAGAQPCARALGRLDALVGTGRCGFRARPVILLADDLACPPGPAILHPVHPPEPRWTCPATTGSRSAGSRPPTSPSTNPR